MNDNKYDNVVMIAKLACVWQLVEVPNGVSPLGRHRAAAAITQQSGIEVALELSRWLPQHLNHRAQDAVRWKVVQEHTGALVRDQL